MCFYRLTAEKVIFDTDVAQGCKNLLNSLTVIPSEGIFEKRSEFINNISDNFNAIMQTKSSRRIKKLSKHSARFIRIRPVKNSDLASSKRCMRAMYSRVLKVCESLENSTGG